MNVADLPCFAVYLNDDYHHSIEWADKLIGLWIATRKALVCGRIRRGAFRDHLVSGIIELSDWRTCFRKAAEEAGADDTDEGLYAAHVAMHRPRAFDLIPSNLHGEFCWSPDWDGEDIEEQIYRNGLRSDRYNSNYINEVRPGPWLRQFLRLVNQSSDAVLTGQATGGKPYIAQFARKCGRARFRVDRDASRPALMTGTQVVAAVENAYVNAIPLVHCEINVRALFDLDPVKPMRLSSRRGEVHVGFHNYVSGAGYMDAYAGEIVIPARARGFIEGTRYRWNINEVYGLVKSCFHTTPVAVG
jgi:hypothetical protein